MAIRTTESLVKQILNVDDDIPLTGFIRAASALTDHVASKDESSLLNSTLLQEIESWLAAHMYSHRDQMYAQKHAGKSGGVFQGMTGMRLDSTQYGQTAMMLDVSGTLASLSRGRHKASLAWLGKPPSEQTDYDDRD
jgi:hypothetical protein